MVSALATPSAGTLTRSRRAPHISGQPLSAPNPEIEEVLDTQSGEHLSVQAVIGSDYVALIQRRMAVSESLKKTPLYRCSLCNGAVFLSCEKTHTRFFFKHRHQPDSCPAMTRGTLSQDDIRALKYNGAKESEKHRQMKRWLVEALQADGRFTNIAEEPIWKGALPKEWRRPDVRAEFQGTPIAFEVQLSTTFLDVIAQRRNFYLEQGGLLFWVFAKFDRSSLRMTEEDVFYNNNLNAFVVNEKTTEYSKQHGRFLLGCYWAEPAPSGEPGPLQKKLVSFDQLTRDLPRQRVFFYDFEEVREAPRRALRAEIEAWCQPASAYYQPGGAAQWNAFVRRLRAMRVDVPESFEMVDLAFIAALYSAKNGQPWGFRHKTLVQVVHNALNSPRQALWVLLAIEKYNRTAQVHAEGTPGKLAAKLTRIQAARAGTPEHYEPPAGHRVLIEFLFPELAPLPASWP
jgi:hypothetical protein